MAGDARAGDERDRGRAARRLGDGWRGPIESVLHAYAQVLLARSLVAGAIVIAVTALEPRLLVVGLASVLVANATARLVGLSPDATREGLLSYNALLVGLGTATLLEPGAAALALGAVAVPAAVLVTASLRSALGAGFGLPVLTLPFLFVLGLVLGAAPLVGAWPALPPVDPSWLGEALPLPVAAMLRGLGALFFLPRADAGLGILAALVAFSRIGALLAALGLALAWVVGAHLSATGDGVLPIALGYNLALVAVALGGVWFVPSPASFALALGGMGVASVVALGAIPLLARLGLPLLILPFNVTVLLVLHAMRQRVRDGTPKAVDFLIGSPEENLRYYRTRVARFGARYFVRLQAPVRGRWTCTQGVEGAHTHRGPWRDAIDLEVLGPDGRAFRRSGRAREDYLGYRLPVVAPAEGTVVRVIDGVADNPIGEMNLRDNWGNLVLLHHAEGLYSLVCHLAPGSVRPREGQRVRRGEVLGACGSSGRSPIPHLHFHLQGVGRIGAPTISLELRDVITGDEDGGPERLHGTLVPAEGVALRNIEPDDAVRELLRFGHGEELAFRHLTDGRAGARERVVAEVDLLGGLRLRSATYGAVLYYDSNDDLFTAFDAVGDRRSALHLLQVALPRAPFELSERLVWTDHVGARWLRPWWVRVWADLLEVLRPLGQVEMGYRARRGPGGVIEVEGTSARCDPGGAPAVRSVVVLRAGVGIERVEVRARGRSLAVERVEAPTVPPGGGSRTRRLLR